MSALALRDASIVVVSSIDWDFVWQAHQEIASRLAAGGNRVVFVENTGGVRSVRVSDTRRVLRRAGSAAAQMLRGDRRPSTNVTVVAPLIVPFQGSRIARYLNDRVFTPRLAAKIRRVAGGDPIVYTYLPTENALRLLDLLGGRDTPVIYHAVADFQAIAPDVAAIARTEAELVRRANVVLVQSAGLKRRFDPLNRNVHDVGIGVDLALFDPDRATVAPEIAGLPHPVIGYIGGVHHHLDFGLLRSLARSFRSGTLVVIGPLLVDDAELPREPNIRYLGARPHAELPELVAAFDVGLIPYRRTTYTATVNPTKLFEYLAMGVPVVSTDLPEVVALALPDSIARVAGDPTEWASAVAAAVSDGDPRHRTLRRTTALDHDWSRIVERIASLVASNDRAARRDAARR